MKVDELAKKTLGKMFHETNYEQDTNLIKSTLLQFGEAVRKACVRESVCLSCGTFDVGRRIETIDLIQIEVEDKG